MLAGAPGAHASNQTQEARALYQKGSGAFKAGDDIKAREYYSQSLKLEESFDAMCNLARSEARSRLFAEAYEHLLLCLYLFPEDKELQEARASYEILRSKVRQELTYEQAYPIDERVDEEIERREAKPSQQELDALPASGLDDPEPVAEKPKSSARLPVTITLGSLGVAGVGTGAVLMLVAGSHKKKAENLSAELPGDSACVGPSPDARCEELQTRLEKLDSNHNAGVVGYAVGGTLLVGAVATYLLWPKPSSEKAWARPFFEYEGDGGWQLGLRGFF